MPTFTRGSLPIEKLPMKSDFWGVGSANYSPLCGVVVHYDAAASMHGSLQYLLEEVDKDPKVSASYSFLLGDGRIVELNDPETRRAWHAGKSMLTSSRRTFSSLNPISVGIAIRNRGWSPERSASHTVLAPMIDGNMAWWEEYKKEDIDNLCNLIHALRCERLLPTKYFIVGHEHVSMSGKADPGPLFPWNFVWSRLQLLSDTP